MKTTTRENRVASVAPVSTASPLDAFPESRLFFRIGDVAEIVGVKPYVLRYWESEFPQVSPSKATSGHRVYLRAEVETLLEIKKLLHGERYSIEGARKRLKAGTASTEATADAVAEPVTYRKDELLALIQELREAVSIPTDVIFRSV